MEIEKEQRRFIWVEKERQKRWHAVAWRELCSMKQEGGIGIKSLPYMNDVFLVKHLRRMHREPNDLWVKMLKGKYGRGRERGCDLIAKTSDSRLWKEMVKMWDTFKQHIEDDGD